MDSTEYPVVAPDELNAAITLLFAGMRAHLVDQGVSLSAARVLVQLRDAGPSRVTELAAALEVSQPTMTTQLQRLAALGWVVRAEDPADGRAVRVELTGRGREVLASFVASRAALLQTGLDRLDPTDRAAIGGAVPALHRLAAVLDLGRAAAGHTTTSAAAGSR